MKLYFKKYFIIILFLLIYDFLFFVPLFFPEQRTIITPEFAGGDSINVYLPYRKILCQSIKEKRIPFWIDSLSFGFPLYAEGEIGYFNPLNYLTCLFFDYRTAFNLQIILHALLFQIGIIFLSFELSFSSFTALFFAFVVPFVPFLLMNLMQFTLVFSFCYFPFILYGTIKILRKLSWPNFIFLSFSICFQFLASHIQISFITFVYVIIFSFFFLLKEKKIKKKFFIFLLIFFSWVFSFFLSGFQTIPLLEFTLNSDRLSSYYQIFSHYDQNLNLRNLLTIFYPYLNGKPKNGTYFFHELADPWEGTIFIYYSPLFFLFYFFYWLIKNKQGEKNIFFKKYYLAPFLFSSFFILLIALGKNSPLYLVHYLPGFNSFRFPTRFLFVFIFLLVFFSSIGFEIFTSSLRKKQRFFLFIFLVLIIFFEAKNFFLDFHVFYPIKNLFQGSLVNDFFKSQKITPQGLFVPFFEYSALDNKYKEGYQGKRGLFFYQSLNHLIIPNVNLIYNLPSLTNKTGPQLSRLPYYFQDIFNFEDLEKKTASLSSVGRKKLILSGIDYLTTTFTLSNNPTFKKIATLKKDNWQIKIYKNIESKKKIDVYDKIRPVSFLEEVDDFFKDNDISEAILETDEAINLSSQKKLDFKINKIKQRDDYYQIKTYSNKKILLVLNTNFYPGWEAKIDGKKTKIYRANFLYQGIIVPAGTHEIKFKYIPHSFFIGLKIAFFTNLFVISFSLIKFFLKKNLLFL